jgi:hypothetical protein
MTNQRAAIVELGLPRDGNADDHVVLLRKAMDEQREAGKQRCKESAALFRAGFADSLQHIRREDEALGSSLFSRRD